MTEDEFRALARAQRFVPNPDGSYSKQPRGTAGEGDNALVQDAKNSVRLERQSNWENLRKTSHAPRTQRVDAKDRPRFRVSITFRFADRRVHDLDGCASTLLDCIVAARRYLDGDLGDYAKGKAVRTGRGSGSDDRDRASAVKGPLPF